MKRPMPNQQIGADEMTSESLNQVPIPSLRDVLQMALDALEYHQQQTRPISQTDAAIESLRAALALPEPKPKPVAWNISYTNASGEARTATHGYNAIGDYRMFDPKAISTPLYAAHRRGAA